MAGTSFSQSLRNRRMAAGYRSARDFAEAIGINENRYSRYERGTAEPSLSMLVKMAELLRATPNELLGYPAAQDAPGHMAPGFDDAGTNLASALPEKNRGLGDESLDPGSRGSEALDILCWQFADAFVKSTAPRARTSVAKSARGGAEHLPRVARVFTLLKSDGLSALSRLLISAEFANAPANARVGVQAAADELLQHLLRPSSSSGLSQSKRHT